MDDRLIVTASPHIRDNATTRGLMGNVLIALVPSIVASGLIFGMRAILLTAVTTLACVVFEYLYCKLMHKPNPVGDLSACVTGVILALNMPVSMPLWIAIVGALVAIVIIKQLFGGLGYNFANPALVGRIVLFLGFTSRMTAYVYPDMSVDALASATPLNAAVDLHSVSFVDMLLGIHGGMMGETCVIAILLGLAYLLFTHTIEFTIPASIVGTMYVLTLLATRDPYIALLDCMSGGLLFGAVFMATDYVTSPFTTKGKLFYGVFIGLVTFLIRNFASMNEGMSFAAGQPDDPVVQRLGPPDPAGLQKAPESCERGKRIMAENNAKAPEQESNFKALVLPVIVLVVICLVCSALLAVLNNATAPIIEANTKAETLAAYLSVLPEGTTADDLQDVTVTTANVTGAVKTADGMAVVQSTAAGYSGNLVTVYAAFDTTGTLTALSVDASTQTTGIGSKTGEESFYGGYVGWSASQQVEVGNPVDAIGGATISSRAVVSAINSAIDCYNNEIAGVA